MAKEWAKLSHCTRKQVGALIVKNGMIISDGYNGERMSNGYFIVSAVLVNTSTPVEFIHNKIEWGTDHTPFITHT